MSIEKISRRELLRMMAAGSAVVVLAACRVTGNDDATPTDQAPAAATAVPEALTGGPTALAATAVATATLAPVSWVPPDMTRITANDEFYVMKYHPTPPPEVDPAAYRLEITGEVDNPVTLTLDEIKAFPAISEMRTLECISNPVGGNLIGNANWTGVAMSALLAHAGLRDGGKYLQFESLDGYHTGIPTALALEEHSLLVYEMNGEPLPAKNGYPLRALWPGRFGQKQPKWIERITVQSTPHVGHWEGQGWSEEARIVPNGRIEQPPERVLQGSDFYVAGIAMTNESGLAQVEISLDDGGNWVPAELLRGPSDLVWTHWWLPVSGLDNGAYRVLARVTDNEGRKQSSPGRNSALLNGTFPDGSDEMHRVVVQVKTS